MDAKQFAPLGAVIAIILAVAYFLLSPTPPVPGSSLSEYGPNFERTALGNGSYNLIVYSGTRFGYEDRRWKKVEEMRSLRGTDIVPVIESDGINLVNVVDYNLTSVTVELSKKSGFGKATPLRVFKIADNGSKTFNLNQTKTFASSLSKQELTIPFSLGSILEFGENSTLVSLNNTAGRGYVTNDITPFGTWDACHDGITGTAASTSSVIVSVRKYGAITYIKRGFLPINSSLIPDDATVTNVTFHFYVTDVNDLDNDGQDYVAIIANTTQASNITLVTADFDQCGAIDNPVKYSSSLDISSISISTWQQLNISSQYFDQIDKTGVTMWGIREGHDIEDAPAVQFNSIAFDSLAGVNESYWNITYSEAPAGTPDTNASIWTGAAWNDFNNTANNLSFAGCAAPSTYCQPVGQNTSTGQAIFNITNNGTAASPTLVAWLNATKTWANLTCSDYNSTASGLVTIGATASTLNSTSTAAGEWHDIFCWLNISATPGADRKWTLTFNYTA